MTVTVDRDVSVVCVTIYNINIEGPKILTYSSSSPEFIHIIGLEEGDFAVLSDGGTFGSSTLNYLLLY